MKYLLPILLLISFHAAAQQVRTENYYKANPVWIGMMRDTNANFLVTEKAFKLFWTDREMPEGEHEEIGERREREKIPSKRKLREVQKENEMRRAVKEYYFWRRSVLPYVQEDGRIATPHERLLIWKQLQRQ